MNDSFSENCGYSTTRAADITFTGLRVLMFDAIDIQALISVNSRNDRRKRLSYMPVGPLLGASGLTQEILSSQALVPPLSLKSAVCREPQGLRSFSVRQPDLFPLIRKPWSSALTERNIPWPFQASFRRYFANLIPAITKTAQQSLLDSRLLFGGTARCFDENEYNLFATYPRTSLLC